MDPNGVIDEVLVAMKNDDRCAEVHFSYKNDISDRSLYLDPHQFRQILWNILLNAVQAIGGKGKIVLDVSLDHMASMWTLKISDNGVGIPKEHLSHIFDPFYTTRTGGTGLGLANVEKIILAHGGRISVISEIDIGSCFIISFPMGRR
jgi:signal transduction histidine kinase